MLYDCRVVLRVGETTQTLEYLMLDEKILNAALAGADPFELESENEYSL